MSVNKDFKLLQEYKHIYLFDYSWSNARQVRLTSPCDWIGKNIDLHEYEGIVFSNTTIKEGEFSITKLEDVLKQYDAKVIEFEDFEKF